MMPVLAADSVLAAPEASGCLPWNVSCQVASWFSSLAISAIRPLLALVGQTELSTGDYTANPAVGGMWTGMLGISDTLFLLLIFAGGIILMGYHTYQGSYTLREVAPRFAIAMAVSNGSLFLTSKAIGVSNGISAAVSGGALPATATSTLTQMLLQGVQGGVMLILLVLAAVIVAIIIAITYVIRQMAMVLLIAMAPLALSGYALPHTSWAARWWWRALATLLAIPPAQALVLNAAMHVFFGPAGWTGLHSSNPFLVNLITALCLLYILARVPFWIARPALMPFGRSPIRSALRFAFGAAVLTRVGRTLRGTGGAAARRSGTRQRGGTQ